MSRIEKLKIVLSAVMISAAIIAVFVVLGYEAGLR
jgi:hypothetical protein